MFIVILYISEGTFIVHFFLCIFSSSTGYGIKLANAATPDILSEDTWKTFWITWEKNTIVFGTGSVRNKSVLLKWKMDKKIKIQQVGFASGWGSLAEFRWVFNVLKQNN